MYKGGWKAGAQRRIEVLISELPEDASLKDRRKILRAGAMSYHGGTSWGKKVWSRECRKYLERHGLDPLGNEQIGNHLPSAQCQKLERGTLAGDIVFPYKGKSDSGG